MENLFSVGVKKIVSAAASRGGRYGWCATTKNRWQQFCNFCDSNDIEKFEQITPDLLEMYAYDRCSSLSVATAQNYISSVNTVLKMFNPDWVSCSPKKLVGRSRCSVRTKPLTFGAEQINCAIAELKNLGHEDLAYVVLFSALFGLRRREAAMLDIGVALREARVDGAIDIRRGTKGGRGRSVERLIPCGAEQIQALISAKNLFRYQQCLIPSNISLKYFNIQISNVCLPILKKHGISRLHELRVFYACERYRELTGCSPPCNRQGGDNVSSHQSDERAREIISQELGHSRIQIVSSYVGRKIRMRGCGDE